MISGEVRPLGSGFVSLRGMLSAFDPSKPGAASTTAFAPLSALSLPVKAVGLRVRRSLTGMAFNDPGLEALRAAIGVRRADLGPLSWDTQRRSQPDLWIPLTPGARPDQTYRLNPGA